MGEGPPRRPALNSAGMNGAMRYAYCALRTEDQFRATPRSNVMGTVKEKATVTQRVHGACATHSRTEISVRDVKALIDEPELLRVIAEKTSPARPSNGCFANAACRWLSAPTTASPLLAPMPCSTSPSSRFGGVCSALT